MPCTSHKLPLIMTFNVQTFHFDTQIFKKSPYRGRGNSHTLPCSVASLPRIGPSFTNPVYTAVTSITKASLKGPCPPPSPVDWSKWIEKRGDQRIGICNVCYFIHPTPNNDIWYAKRAILIHTISRIPLPWEGDTPSPARSLRSLALPLIMAFNVQKVAFWYTNFQNFPTGVILLISPHRLLC